MTRDAERRRRLLGRMVALLVLGVLAAPASAQRPGPVPQVDDATGPTRAGVGDLTWLSLLVVAETTDFTLTLNVGHLFASPFHRP